MRTQELEKSTILKHQLQKLFTPRIADGCEALCKINKSEVDLLPFDSLKDMLITHYSTVGKSKKIENWKDLDGYIDFIKDKYQVVVVSCKFYDKKSFTINTTEENLIDDIYASISLISDYIPHKRIHLLFSEKNSQFHIKMAPVVTTA